MHILLVSTNFNLWLEFETQYRVYSQIIFLQYVIIIFYEGVIFAISMILLSTFLLLVDNFTHASTYQDHIHLNSPYPLYIPPLSNPESY